MVNVERREFQRIKKKFRVLFRRTKDLFWLNKSVSENISLGGLKVNLNKMLLVGDTIRLKLIAGVLQRPITADAKVVWIEDNTASKIRNYKYSVGLQFTNVGWTQLKKVVVEHDESAANLVS